MVHSSSKTPFDLVQLERWLHSSRISAGSKEDVEMYKQKKNIVFTHVFTELREGILLLINSQIWTLLHKMLIHYICPGPFHTTSSPSNTDSIMEPLSFHLKYFPKISKIHFQHRIFSFKNKYTCHK